MFPRLWLGHNINNKSDGKPSDLFYTTIAILIWYKQKKEELSFFLFSTPSGARTLDPNIKSVVLYQLS